MDFTQIAMTWVVWPNGEKVVLTCVQMIVISTEVRASHRKSTQVRASTDQTESQVCDSI